jgi:predicted metalloendopeptidase
MSTTTKTPTDILRGKSDALACFQECGCLSQCIREDLDDAAWMAKFYATAAKRKLHVVRVKPGEPFVCECEEHQEKRLAKKKQRSLMEARDAIRAAGGDAWDKIEDPAEYLGRASK